MSSNTYATYNELRNELVSLQREFETPIQSPDHLYHDLIWTPEFESWSSEEFNSFVAANKRGYREHWIRWPQGTAISRFTWRLNDGCLEEFLKLRERGNSLLRSFEHLVDQDADIPNSVRFEYRNIEWLELVHDFGRRFSTTGLCTRLLWWGESSERLESEMSPDEKTEFRQHITYPADSFPFHTHPMSSQLLQDVYSASSDLIRQILDPDSVIPVNWGDGEIPIFLPEALEIEMPQDSISKGPTEWKQDEPESMTNVFRHENEKIWHIRFTTDSIVEEEWLPNWNGLRHIAFLLQRPGELVEGGDIDPRESKPGDQERAFQEVMDEPARRALMLRIQELEDAYDAAEATGNDQRLAEVKGELDQLNSEKAKSINCWGQSRRLGALPEKIRTFERVRKNIARACKSLEPTMPQLAAFLQESIRSNSNAYSYQPRNPVDWMF